jgi:hypothetical protein
MTPGGSGPTLATEYLEHARRVADAILYEGYLLYPYRQSAQKNQARFQFGVLMPPGYAAADPSEATACQTECLLECADSAEITVLVRFLQLVRRRVLALDAGTGVMREVSELTVDGTQYTCFEEAAEREQRVRVVVSDLLAGDVRADLTVEPGEQAEDLTESGGHAAGKVVRHWSALAGVIRLHAERVAGPYQALRLRVRLENAAADATQPSVPRRRDDALEYALIAAHCLIEVPGGRFLSMTDPPEWAAAEVTRCQNIGTWPVLGGPPECTGLLLSSPVILYDHPEVAAESAGDLFDATEIDEILTLRTLALTDEEKRQARATDSRAADLLDRLDDMPPEMLERMHGAIRYLRAAPTATRSGTTGAGPPSWLGSLSGDRRPNSPTTSRSDIAAAGPDITAALDVTARPSVPWWDPGADASVSPETDQVLIDGVAVRRDSHVLMQPGSRRADAQDLFLAGREAVVEAVLFDVDGQAHLAVTPLDDPAADLHRNHGRFLYFAPDEVQPLPPGSTKRREGGGR